MPKIKKLIVKRKIGGKVGVDHAENMGLGRKYKKIINYYYMPKRKKLIVKRKIGGNWGYAAMASIPLINNVIDWIRGKGLKKIQKKKK